MKKCIFLSVLVLCNHILNAQSAKIELYDLVKQFLYDSSGFKNVGDWGVKHPKKYAVNWKADKLEMSPDTSINFYRLGTADVKINGRTVMQKGVPVQWQFMLKGPRMGYMSFSTISTPSTEFKPKYNLDSLFGNRPYTFKLLRSCEEKTLSGHYYYEVKIPKKDVAFIKVSWISVNGNTAIRLDCFDNYSRYAVKLDCPK
ncbi:MAG: hypothetical protein LH478_08540 [Chitinophagaceae bacterium]|nr:hypothetical protein [Chitinophagaceae bacterium]